MGDDTEPWALVTSDYLGDPKPVIMYAPFEGVVDDMIAFRDSEREIYLKTMMLEKYPARFSPTLMKAVADARKASAEAKMEQFAVMMFDASNFSGVIARELRNGARGGN